MVKSAAYAGAGSRQSPTGIPLRPVCQALEGDNLKISLWLVS